MNRLNHIRRYHWDWSFSLWAILFSSSVVFLIALLFEKHVVSLQWTLPGLAVVIVFFTFFSSSMNRWMYYDDRTFMQHLIVGSLIVRTLAVGVVYIVLYKVYGMPFDDGGDAIAYHESGTIISEGFLRGDLNIENAIKRTSYYYYWDYTDYGFPSFVGIVYTIFGANTIALRLMNVLLGTCTVVLTYRIAEYIFDRISARITGLLMMLFPYLIFWTGMHMKETIFLFLIVLVVYLYIRLTTESRTPVMLIIPLIGTLLYLYFFRSFFLVLMLATLFLLPNLRKRSLFTITTFTVVFIGVIFIGFYLDRFGLGIQDSLQRLVNRVPFIYGTELDVKQGRVGSRFVSIQDLVSFPLFVLAVFPAPFPSIVAGTQQELSMIQIGCAFVKNIMVYFFFVGLYHQLRKNAKRIVAFIFFLIANASVLVVSVQVTSHRYQLPLLPFLLIFMGVGIKYTLETKKIWPWVAWLGAMGIATLAWNYFRLQLRGLV